MPYLLLTAVVLVVLFLCRGVLFDLLYWRFLATPEEKEFIGAANLYLDDTMRDLARYMSGHSPRRSTSDTIEDAEYEVIE